MTACAYCGASLADDQRYCLECGGRQVQARSQFLERFTPAAVGPQERPAARQATMVSGRSSTAVAGVGVLLLAMGVGVLIGRAGAGKTSTAPAQVISVAAPGATAGSGTTATNSASTEIPEDWSAGKSGYAVQLQRIPAASAQASEVASAKSAALAKGAAGVGVLLSSNFSSLPTGQYVLYSGDYPSEARAKQALGPLKAKFPGAAVIHVSGGSESSSATSSSGEGGSSSHSSSGSSPSGPSSSGGSSKGGSSSKVTTAPKSSAPNSGQSYEQKSRALPNVVTTG